MWHEVYALVATGQAGAACSPEEGTRAGCRVHLYLLELAEARQPDFGGAVEERTTISGSMAISET